MKYTYIVNGKIRENSEIKDTYGKKLLDTMLRSMGYCPVKKSPNSGEENKNKVV